MNQILSTYKKDNNLTPSMNKKRKKSVFFKFQFIVCSIIAVSISSYYAYSLYENNKKEAVSQKLANNFNITTLYSDTATYSTTSISSR